MDSLKSLLDAKKYDLVIKLTEKSEVVNDLFYRIAAFTLLDKKEEALYVIQDHQKDLESNLVALVPIHIELLCALDRFEQAETVLDYYSNLPYQSQVVEEMLRKMPQVIANYEKKEKLVTISDEELSKKLLSDNVENVLYAIDLLKKRDIFEFLPDVVKVMTTHPKQMVRSLALILLVDKEVDRELPFLSHNGVIMVNPKKITPPFIGVHFIEMVKRMDREFKDLTLSQNGAHILSNYAIYIYPNEIDKDFEELLLAVEITAKQYMSIPTEEIELEAKNKGLDKTKVIYYFNKIKEALEDF